MIGKEKYSRMMTQFPHIFLTQDFLDNFETHLFDFSHQQNSVISKLVEHTIRKHFLNGESTEFTISETTLESGVWKILINRTLTEKS